VALADCGTHAIFDAEIGPYTMSEAALSRLLVDRLEPGMVLFANRGVTGFALWQQAVATGAELLWRAKNNVPRQIEVLADRSWLGEMRLSNTRVNTDHVVVHVVGGTVDDGRDVETGPFRLFAATLDPGEVTATELADAYAQRSGDRDDLRRTQDSPARLEDDVPFQVAGLSPARASGVTCAASTRSAP